MDRILTDQFSDDDSFNALTDEDFDLLQLTEEERAELDLVAVVNREGNEQSGDELDPDDDNMPLFYTQPSFQWASGNYLPPKPSTRTKSEHWPGPVRVLGGSRTALDYFQLFYSDTVLKKKLFNSQMTINTTK